MQLWWENNITLHLILDPLTAKCVCITFAPVSCIFEKVYKKPTIIILESDKQITLSAWPSIRDMIKIHAVSNIQLFLATDRTKEVFPTTCSNTWSSHGGGFCDMTSQSLEYMHWCFRQIMKCQNIYQTIRSHIPEGTFVFSSVCKSQGCKVWAHTHWPYIL